MSTIRVGSTKEYADGWDNIFGGKKSAASREASKRTAKKVTARKRPAKRPAKKK